MFQQLSKITASTIRYTSSFFSQYNRYDMTPQLVNAWLQDIQTGLDALFDDQIMLAEDVFSTLSDGPFHAFGHALLIYTKAMLAMEKTKIDQAIECVAGVENLVKRMMISNRKKKRVSTMQSASSYSLDRIEPKTHDDFDLHFELLLANCILMAATLQFLKDSWVDNIKAAYDLRKAYKMYEHLFEIVTGTPIEEYEARHLDSTPKARRTVSYDHGVSQQPVLLYDETIIHGAFFGIGLFNVIFSILPTKVGKILNSLGFHSSRRTAINLLQRSYNSNTMYSSLSSLVLLSFYTNISIYIQPSINQFFHFQDARDILDTMKLRYPNGPIWSLVEGKFQKVQGQLDDSILLFQQSKKPTHPTVEESKDVTPEDHFRNASITEFNQFRSFAVYDMGWSFIFSGNYFQASESFFCLESMCNWSRVFYHYVSTCCMIADGLYSKAALEIKQMISLLDDKKRLNHRISSNESFAESRLRSWLDRVTKEKVSLQTILQHHIVNPLWEIVYLWNGVAHWKKEVAMDIKQHIKATQKQDLFLLLLLGVIARDHEREVEVALEYFNLITHFSKEQKHWITPYAMYEIAATYCKIMSKTRSKRHISEYKTTALHWIKSIENYYSKNTNDTEWETRLQMRCELIVESCSSIQ